MTTETHFFHDTVTREWRAPASKADYKRMTKQVAEMLNHSFVAGTLSVNYTKDTIIRPNPVLARDLLEAIGIRAP